LRIECTISSKLTMGWAQALPDGGFAGHAGETRGKKRYFGENGTKAVIWVDIGESSLKKKKRRKKIYRSYDSD